MQPPTGNSSARLSTVATPIERSGAAAWFAWLGGAAGSTLLPFALVLYLALQGGGYDVVVRSEVGVIVWWAVLLGVIVGLLPGRVGFAGWAGLGLLAAFATWTALGISWSDSAERSVLEVARVVTYLGVLGLALMAQGREGLRRTVNATAAAIAVVGVLALLSRIHPQWFATSSTAEFLPGAADRLGYPLDYWNGLAALMAMGIPLLLVVGQRARTAIGSAAAVAAIPLLALVAYYTLSRGGSAAIAVSIVVLVALSPRRLGLLPPLVIAAAGSAILIVAASQRELLEQGGHGAAALAQGDEMVAMSLVVAAGAGLLAAAARFAARAGLAPSIQVPRRAAAIGAGALAVLAALVFVAAGGPAAVSDGVDEFTTTGFAGSGTERFQSFEGGGRWEWWKAAVDANETAPLTGIGPGTFEYWWAENGTLPGFVRDAHSLYLETFGELGAVGLGLLIAVLGWPLLAGVRRLGSASVERRALLAGAIAAMSAFLVAAAVDWVWELAVLPVAFLILAAAVLGARRERPDAEEAPASDGWRPLLPRIAIGAVAVVALFAIGIPLASTNSVRASQDITSTTADPVALEAALEQAREAADLQPYAASPFVEQAIVLEIQGRLDEAAVQARQAAGKEPTNWRTWFTLARIEAEGGDVPAALAAYRQAKQLNPRSSLFAG